MIDLTEAARVWSAEHPRVVETTTRYEESGIKTALFSSALDEIVRIELDLPSGRPPGDKDLLIRHGDLALAAHQLGVTAQRRFMRVHSGDGHNIGFIADEVVVTLSGDEIQMVDPVTPVHCIAPRTGSRKQSASYRYDTRFTDDAVDARTIIETNEGILPLAHIADTVMLYAINQRTRTDGKNDAQNTANLLLADDLLDPYTFERGEAIGLNKDNGRAWRFIGAAGQLLVAKSMHRLAGVS